MNQTTRRRTLRKRPRPIPGKKNAYSGKGEVLVIDSTEVRKKALSAYKRARTTFKKAETELQQYQSKDLPAYERWHRNAFGPILSRIEDMKRQASELNESLQVIDELKFHYYGDVAAAYAHWEEEKNTLEELQAQHEEDAASQTDERTAEEEPFWEDETKKLFEELELELIQFIQSVRHDIAEALRAGAQPREVLEALFQQFCAERDLPYEVLVQLIERPAVKELLQKRKLLTSKSSPSKSSTPKLSKQKQIKKLARELAFALHPDQCDEQDVEKLNLWHQVQVAVKAKDLDGLEVIYAHVKLMKGDADPSVLVGQMMDLTTMYKNSRKALRRQLGHFRKTTAWQFSERDPENLKDVHKAISAQLLNQEAYIIEILKEMEQEMDGYRRAANAIYETP